MANPSGPGRSSGSSWMKLLWPSVTLGALILFNVIFTSGFGHIEVRDGNYFGSLIDIPKNAAPIAMTGIGMTLVIATGGVDLSVAAVMAIAGSIAALIAQRHGASLTTILLASLGVSLACGLWNGILVSLVRVQPIIATLLLMVAGRGVAQLITHDKPISFSNPGLEHLGRGYLAGLPFQIILVVLAVALTAALTRLTALGLFIEAVGDNETASRFAGINDRLVKLAVYVFSGVCAGLAGLIATANIATADPQTIGIKPSPMELDAILAAVIGGTALTGGRFSLLGTVLGALIIQTLSTMIQNRGIPVQYTLVVKAVVVLIVCLLQSPKVQRMLSSLWPQPARAV